MKKAFALLLVLVLAVSMTATALAAPSSTQAQLSEDDVRVVVLPGDVWVIVQSIAQANYGGNILAQNEELGSNLKSSIEYYVSEYVKTLPAGLSEEEVEAKLRDFANRILADVNALTKTANARAEAKRLGVADVEKLVPVAMIDISLAAKGTAVIDSELVNDRKTVTANISSITGGTDRRVVILHYLMLEGEWELAYDDVTEDNLATFPITTFSPFLFMVEETGGNDPVVPKTGDSTPVGLLIGLAVMSVLGCAYCIKRIRA